MAQGILGFAYAHGLGIPQDYGEAVRWWRKAAEQGNAEAQFNLAFMYGRGKGVPKDYLEAHIWYSLAASLANAELAETLAYMRDLVAKEMTPQQIAEAQRLAREWKPTKPPEGKK